MCHRQHSNSNAGKLSSGGCVREDPPQQRASGDGLSLCQGNGSRTKPALASAVLWACVGRTLLRLGSGRDSPLELRSAMKHFNLPFGRQSRQHRRTPVVRPALIVL